MTSKVQIGDVFEIPLSDGRKAFGQYVYRDEQKGPIVRIFDVVVENDMELDICSLENAGLLFPPVITGVFAAVRTGLWQKVGNLPSDDFQYQNFISRVYDPNGTLRGPWFLWNGEHSRELGYDLPPEYRNLEFLIVWNPINLTRRIETGENYYTYANYTD